MKGMALRSSIAGPRVETWGLRFRVLSVAEFISKVYTFGSTRDHILPKKFKV